MSSTGSALSLDTYTYDGNLRLSGMAASWQSGSGNSGTYFSQALSYDPASNLTSLLTTQASVPGVSNSGGSETQVFCYDEQNRLTWAGNSGTPSCSGNGTPSVSGGIPAYSSSYAYTNLGQLAQGPLAGGSEYQYLYCTSSQPHQLTGLYPIGTTCSNLSGAVYTCSYDSWGNVTSRTYSGTTATLSYDLLDHLTKWLVSSTNKEQYAYDASGERVLRRSTTSSSTTITVYAFGLEEHQYSGSGTNQGNIYYYSLAGHLIGALDANGTQFYLTDVLGSLLAGFTNVANGATLKGNQLFGPYGTARYNAGSLNTAKGFTGQYNDSLTGLDYYGARYYDPVVGVFLSADTQQGNLQGMNPYAYVGGNPETHSDPTGQAIISSCFATCGGKEYYPSVANSGGFIASALSYLQGVGGASGQSSGASVQSKASQANATDPCLVQSCSSTVLANTGSVWATNSNQSATACILAILCFQVSVPTVIYHLVDTYTPLMYCTMGCGEGGDENSLEAESQNKAEIIVNEIKGFEAALPGDASGDVGGKPPSDQSGEQSDLSPVNSIVDPYPINSSELIENGIRDLQSKPNNIHHIFDNPGHQWGLTGLDESGNWDLIRTTLENNTDEVFKGGIYEVEENFVRYNVTVRGNFAHEFLFIGDAWINVI